MGRCPEFSGGGLKRSKTLEEAGPQERWAYDERVLGDGSFVEALVLAEETKAEKSRRAPEEVLGEVCAERGLTRASLVGSAKAREVVAARILLASKLSLESGLKGAEIARILNTTDSAVSKMLAKAREGRKCG